MGKTAESLVISFKLQKVGTKTTMLTRDF